MKLNFSIFFSLFFFSLNATETYWDGETSLNISDCRTQSKRFMPTNDLKSLGIWINHGTLNIKESADSFIAIQAKGSKKNLNKITFFQDHNGYYLKDKNDPEQNYSNSGISTTNTCDNNIVFSNDGTHISHSYSGTAIHGMCIIQNSSENQNLISQQTLLKEAGENNIYEMISLNNVALKNLRMGTCGFVISGQIVRGQIEQNGKIYGPGTIFSEETSSKSNIPNPSVPDGNIKKPKLDKPTLITLYLPKITRTWNISFKGGGPSQIKIDKIYANTLRAEIFDNAEFNLLNSEATFLKLIGNNKAKLQVKGSFSDSIDLKSSNNSFIYVMQQQKQIFQTLKINSQNFGQVCCSGNHATCKENYEITASNRSKITVDALYVLASKARIETFNSGNVSLCCSFTSFDAFLNNSSILTIQEFESASEKSIKAALKEKNLHSTAIVKQYGEFNLFDWVNKIIVDVQNNGQCTINMTRPMEATIITAQNNAKVKLLMPVARAKVTAKNNSEVFLAEVTDILDDNSSKNAKIRADIQPSKDFVF